MTTRTMRNVVVTGAASGIGRGVSRALTEQGHKVFMLDYNKDELAHAADKLSSSHGQALKFKIRHCDLRRLDDMRAAVDEARQFFNGRADVLINNAAYTASVGAANTSNINLDQWNASVETNLTAPLFMSQYCCPMLEQSQVGGCIIHIASTRAFMSEPDNEAYSATKAGLLGLSQSMAVSLAPKRIRVNVILPGWINVSNENKAADEQGKLWEDGLSKDDHRWHLTGRVGKVEDVVHAVDYLMHADFVTGSEMIVDGGVTRKMIYPE